MNQTQKTTLKIIKIAGVCLLFTFVFFILKHNIGNAWKTTDYHPTLSSDPVYVEFSPDSPLSVTLIPEESFNISSVDVVLVNISSKSSGTLSTTLTGSEGVLMSAINPLSELSVGSWNSIATAASLNQGEEYTITFSVDSGNPYFMSLPEASGNDLPYSLNVSGHGDAYISLGLCRADISAVSFGDVFYYSYPLCILAFIFLIAWIIMGNNLFTFLRSIPRRTHIKQYGNEIFMIILYIAVCIGIYSHSYVQSVFITSDSTGYMREAVNLVSGNGFSYDGLAGYKSWFANWPILYPLLLAAVMLIGGTNAYMASKILSMITVFAIMLVIYLYAKKDAWIYSLAIINLGFVMLTEYTWSELPFMFFMMCFGIVLGKILKTDHPSQGLYFLSGLLAFMTFMTRYYGLFIYFVIGAYIIYYLIYSFHKYKGKNLIHSIEFHKAVCLSVTAVFSGILCLVYLLINKLQNGMASGVSRTMWWDDYGILTDDLIKSLLTEFFHIFSLETPNVITSLPVKLQVWILFLILILVIAVIRKPLKIMNEHSVWIVMSLIYYLMFIAIRYVSSMDTFYFRFFEPATFLLTLGVIGYFIPIIRTQKESVPLICGSIICIFVLLTGINDYASLHEVATPYYKELTQTWDSAYSEIPSKSVVIFSDLDFRSSYYRPDVVEGSIDPGMNMEAIQNLYYGSDYMCIKRTDALSMVAEPVYPQDVESALIEAINSTPSTNRYICIKLK